MTNLANDTKQIDGLNDRYLLFSIDDSYYGLPLAMALEILTIQSITRLPRVAPYIKGIINLRGKVIPVLDVRTKLGISERAYDDKTCIIVIDLHDMHVGLIVDMVCEVLSVPQENIIPPPKNYASYISSVSQLDDKIVLNLDCETFFQNDLEQIRV
ncbi:MAG: purine-binding chemotaxis protein CheW [Clostridiales bacterium]|jgi:purine-binding chemotaxis protein CheW|nr:purine-binding chemotaxis protein CheW [Clostridiales bacterium]